MPGTRLLNWRHIIAGVFVVFVLSVYVTPCVSSDDSKSSVTQLIDDLTQIDSQAPGIDSAAIYDGFIAEDASTSFHGGVLGVPPPKVPPQMRELVRRGPRALPDLIRHLDDRRPTSLAVGNKDSASPSHQVGVDFFMFTVFSDEYDPRLRRSFSEEELGRGRLLLERKFQGRYTVKVGDVCFVLIGQIVNRQLLAVRYQASAGLVVNSPIETPELAEKVRNDWGKGNVEMLKASLLADIRTGNQPKEVGQIVYSTGDVNSALRRLRLYFRDTYDALKGDDLKKRRIFEEQENRRQSGKKR